MRSVLGNLATLSAIFCLTVFSALPAQAQTAAELTNPYTQLQDRMTQLRDEAAGLYIESWYCPPPKPPSKREHEGAVEAMRQRAAALQREYNTMKGSLKQQALNPIYGPQYSAAGVDPNDPRFFEAGDRLMASVLAEIAKRQAELDRTPTRPCTEDPAPPKPLVRTGPLSEAEEAVLDDFPLTMPKLDGPLTWPALPSRFCSYAERTAYLRDVFWPMAERFKQNALKAISAHSDAEKRLREVSANDRDGSPRIALAERSVEQWRKEKDARMKAHQDFLKQYDAITDIPVVDCGRPKEETALQVPGGGTLVGEGPGKPGKPDLTRPQFAQVPDLAVPPCFYSEVSRVEFLQDVYNPAVAKALSNARAAQDHLAKLSGLFTEHMRANTGHWAAVRAERDAYEPIAREAAEKAEALRQLYDRILAVKIGCGGREEPNPRVRTGDGGTPVPVTPPVERVPCPPGKRVGDGGPCPRPGRQPITVGSNSQVGSGAQLRKKLGGMAMGALAGALGGGGGGGGGDGGPDLWTCKIKDSEMTVFNDPATGVSLRVGAKRAKGQVVIFSEIAKSPDKGTFQTAFLERPSTGEVIGPKDAGPCDLWGEWKLTVSWTKTTYVDGQMVSQESGGWSEGGFFKIPGVLSKTEAPDGLWKRMGFSNASNGARKMAAIFDAPAGGGPLTFVIHVTRPKGDPVTTVPFVLTMTEGPDGFVFAKAEEEDCPPEMVPIGGPKVGQPAPGGSNPGPETATAGGPATTAQTPAPTTTGPTTTKPAEEPYVGSGSSYTHYADEARKDFRATLDQMEALKGPCPEAGQAWEAHRRSLLRRIRWRLGQITGVRFTGDGADGFNADREEEIKRLTDLQAGVEAMTSPCPGVATDPDDLPDVQEELSMLRTTLGIGSRSYESGVSELEKADRCDEAALAAWLERRRKLRMYLMIRRKWLDEMVLTGADADAMAGEVEAERRRVRDWLERIDRMHVPPCPAVPPGSPPPPVAPGPEADLPPTPEEEESILDSIEEVLVPA